MPEEVLEVGQPAPLFELATNSSETISLEQFKGKFNVVLFFYPKADTPGCTVEACSFRDSIASFEAAGTQVLGISADTVKKQAKFAEKFGFQYPLLADVDHVVAEKYGVWKLKKFMGREYMGIERSTFVIDKNGVLAHVFSKVTPLGHAEEVLNVLESMESR